MYLKSKVYTKFITTLGFNNYQVLLFGLINDPSLFQQYVNKILFQHLYKFCQIYLDDVFR